MTKEINGEFFVDLNVMVVRKKDFKEDDVVDKIMSSLADQDGFQMVVSPLHQAIDRQTAELQKELEDLKEELRKCRAWGKYEDWKNHNYKYDDYEDKWYERAKSGSYEIVPFSREYEEMDIRRKYIADNNL